MQRRALFSLVLLTAASAAAADRWINPVFKPLEMDRRSFTTPILKIEKGGLMTVDGDAVIISRDNGRTWPERKIIYQGPGSDKPGPGIPSGSGQFFRTADGVLVLVYKDARVLNWDNEKGEFKEGSRADVWSIRSLDGGATWTDRHKIFEGVCGPPPVNLIQTRNGNLVVPVQYYVRLPAKRRPGYRTPTSSNAIRDCFGSSRGRAKCRSVCASPTWCGGSSSLRLPGVTTADCRIFLQ